MVFPDEPTLFCKSFMQAHERKLAKQAQKKAKKKKKKKSDDEEVVE